MLQRLGSPASSERQAQRQMLAALLHMCLLVSEQAGCKHRLQGSTCMYGHTVQSTVICSGPTALTLAQAPLSHACLAHVGVETRDANTHSMSSTS